jgi:mannose-1-phosphate guanylyltransferase
MKALILAAGLGTRLRPLTDTVPKTLVPIGGKPLLAYHLKQLSLYGITDVLINTHYLSEQVDAFVAAHKDDFPGLTIHTAFEKNLLGSAGTLKENKSFFEGEDDFFIVYGDNLTNIDYDKLLSVHKKKKGIMTIASYHEEHPETKGVISFDSDERILKFIEKPKGDQIISNYANAGIYAVNATIFDYLDSLSGTPLDFGFDVFPFLLGKNEAMYAYMMDEFLLDIGTFESYTKSQELVSSIF